MQWWAQLVFCSLSLFLCDDANDHSRLRRRLLVAAVQAEYVGICVVTALATFVLWPILSGVSVLSHMGTGMDGWLSQAIDTIGLASFCVAGTQHGIRRGLHPLMTIVICCITCSGGGIMRDVSAFQCWHSMNDRHACPMCLHALRS